MTPKPAQRLEKPTSRERLLDAAETLLADHGIDGVSLRQIGAATGQGNNSAVQYYFGDKSGLIREIILRRVSAFEGERRSMMARLRREGRIDDLESLLKILFLPLTTATDDNGRHVYIRFLVQFLTRFQYQTGIQHPGWAPDSAATEAVHLIADCLGPIPQKTLIARINRVGGLFFYAVIDRDNALASGREVESEEEFFSDLFTMMSSALIAGIPGPHRVSGAI